MSLKRKIISRHASDPALDAAEAAFQAFRYGFYAVSEAAACGLVPRSGKPSSARLIIATLKNGARASNFPSDGTPDGVLLQRLITGNIR